jgi:hypothetical protein
MGAGAAAGAPSVAISGSLQDGSTVTAVVRGGKAKATQWQRCPAALRAGQCAKPQRIGTRRTLGLNGRAGQRIRAVVTLRASSRRVSSQWRVVLAAPAPTPAPTPAPAPRAGSTRESPIPLGQAQSVSDGWTMRAVSFTPDATAAVLAENMFNDPPAAGKQFAIARVEASNATTAPASFGGSFRLRAVGPSNVSFSTFSNSCGVIPDPISSTQVFPGGTIAGNVCWEVPTSDVGGLVMYDSASYSASTWTYFALR